MNEDLNKEWIDSRSWTIYKTNGTALKRCDKSFFESNETGLPKKHGITDFWGVNYIDKKRNVTLIHCNHKFTAQVITKKDSSNRSILKWNKDLKDFFIRFKANNMVVCFRKITNDEYCFDILSDKDDEYEINEVYSEGNPKYYETVRYERNSSNRKNAILIHGLSCEACGFNFESFYGDLGKNYIEVHHVIPLYLSKHNHEINPETDLICLCSNCHRMIHRIKNEETEGTLLTLKEYIKKNT